MITLQKYLFPLYIEFQPQWFKHFSHNENLFETLVSQNEKKC